MRKPTLSLLALFVALPQLTWQSSPIAPLAIGRAVAAQSPALPIKVGPTVHVSSALSQVFHDEVTLASDPADARRLIACSIIDPSHGGSERRRKTAAYLSFDRGLTWEHGITSELDTGDPSCDFAPDGSVYFMSISSRSKLDRLGTWTLELRRSRDGGHTWESARHSAGGDRPWLIVDRSSRANPTPIYATYHTSVRPLRADGRPAPLGLYLKRSDDGGVTWTAPAIRLGEVGRSEVSGVTPGGGVVLSDGTVAILYVTPQDFPGAMPSRPPLESKGLAQFVTTSDDGGRTLGDGIKVANVVSLSGIGGAVGTFAPLAADRGSQWFKDRLYAAWPDAKTGRSEICFSFSDDKGATWSTPRIVSDDHPWPPPAIGPDSEMPTLAVNKNGVVGLMWYDRRDSPDNTGFHPRFRASLDGGETWLPSVRLSNVANRFEGGESVRLLAFVWRRPGSPGTLSLDLWRHWWPENGHTAGLAADANGAFHGLWVDNRTGINQVYTARVDVDGVGVKHGSTELAAYEDVTSLVAVELSGAVLDPEKHTITVRARVHNTSDRRLNGPLVLRALAITSEIGTARVANAEQGSGEGSVWSFETPADGLAPQATTAEQALNLAFSPSRSVKEGADVRIGLVKLEVRVLAPQK